MHAAKRAGGNSYAFFEPHMNAGVREQIELQSDLRLAIERGELELYYQPKVSVGRSVITGVEALVRWRLANNIRAAVYRHGIDPSLLTFEITESVAMEDAEGTLQAFEGLARVGVKMAEWAEDNNRPNQVPFGASTLM